MDSKKSLALALSLLLLLTGVFACVPADPVEMPNPSKTEGGVAKEEVITLALPGTVKGDLTGYFDLSDDLRESLWAFASKTSGPALDGQDGKNSLYSPVSLYYALAMLEAGAAGETKAGLRSFLEAGEGEIGPELQVLYALMTEGREGSLEELANGLWIRKDLLAGKEEALRQDWLDLMSNYFYASAFAVDFQDAGTARQMSEWVAEATHGKIKPAIQLDDPLLYLVLMNTLYFQAEWAERFDPVPDLEAFYPKGLESVEASYLSRYFRQYPALRTDRYTAVQVSLKNGSIRFVLPASGLDPETLLKDPAFLVKLRAEEGESIYDIDFKVPMFEYPCKLNLLDSLADLGLTALVEEGADFSAMFEGEIWVSGISQESFIALDEKGIEAAAYTDVHMAGAAAPQETEEIEIHLNRPFLYVISDQVGAPLFVGVVHNPGESPAGS